MNPKISKKYLRSSIKRLSVTASILTVVSYSGFSQSSFASGGDDACEEAGCSVSFDPGVIDRSNEVPFFLSYHTLYGGDFSHETDKVSLLGKINLKEWSDYLGAGLSSDVLQSLLYKKTAQEVREIISAVNGKGNQASANARAIAKTLLQNHDRSFLNTALEYLVFAKRAEPFSTQNLGADSWDYYNPKPKPAISEDARALIEEAGKRLASTATPFLRDRYRFQVIRMMYYTGKYVEAQKYFEENGSSLSRSSSIFFRFRDIGAGAYFKNRHYGIANYLFSLNFDQFVPLKKDSWLSFRPQENADWNESLSYAKSKRERAVLWQMFGISADGIVAINKIYEIDPQSDLLPLLVSREVNKAENRVLSQSGAWGANEGTFTYNAKDPNSNEQRLNAVKQIANRGNTFKSYLWDLATAHLFAINGDARSAIAYLKKGAQSAQAAQDKKFLKQAKMTRLLAEIQSPQAIDPKRETYFGSALLWLAKLPGFYASNLKVWTLTKLSKVYQKQGDTLTALLLVENPRHPAFQDNRNLDTLISRLSRTEKSPFERMLQQFSGYTVEQLKELKAINLSFQQKFADATPLFQELKQDSQQELYGDPFLIHINDCHDCDFLKPHNTWTKAHFAGEMARLQRAASQENSSAAAASFQFANGLYNMSEYGNARAFYSSPHGNFSYGSYVDSDRRPKVLPNDAAQAYYERATSLSKDREFQAKAAFMAAKTEQNQYYNRTESTQFEASLSAVHSPKFFGILKSRFSDTQYYQEIIRECGYFRDFAKKN